MLTEIIFKKPLPSQESQGYSKFILTSFKNRTSGLLNVSGLTLDGYLEAGLWTPASSVSLEARTLYRLLTVESLEKLGFDLKVGALVDNVYNRMKERREEGEEEKEKEEGEGR